jgi:hypothetical protein
MSDRPSAYRDLELGAALRELEVPEHRPEFHAELHRLLAEERIARLREERRRRRVRRGYLRWGVRAAAVAAAGALAFVVLDVVRSGHGPGSGIQLVQPASAAEVKRHVRAALDSAKNLSGKLVVRGRSYKAAFGWERPTHWRFTITADGDYLLVGPTPRERIAYDASTGHVRSAQTSASIGGNPTLFYAARRGVAPGPPDELPGWIDLLQRDFASFVRALLAADDPRVHEVTYAGRAAWRLDVDALPNALVPDFSGNHFSVWVDQETGLPVRVIESKNGVVLRELRIERLAVDRRLPADTFTVRFPSDAEVMRSNEGFRRVGLSQVRARVGYAPLVPDWVPPGYELTEVAVAPGSGNPTGAEAGNPLSTDAVSLSYRRGLDQLLVTTRLRHVPGYGDQWGDPLATGEGFVDHPERIRARRGALSGVELNLLIVPRAIPHVWALTDDLVVTVGGDLTRAELLRVTESLAARP